MPLQTTTHSLPLPTITVPPAAPRLKPKALPSIGNFVINPLIGGSHTLAFDFRHHDVLTRDQLLQPAAYPFARDFFIRVVDEDYAVDPLDEKLIFVEARAGIITNEDVIRAVRERIVFEDRELEELGIRGFGRSLYKRVWGGLGVPDSDGVCTLRLRRAV